VARRSSPSYHQGEGRSGLDESVNFHHERVKQLAADYGLRATEYGGRPTAVLKPAGGPGEKRQ
jgi:hypothetical protein